MESEFVSPVKLGGDLASGCEEILMPASSITNGVSSELCDGDLDGTVEYLEENDPMGDINDVETQPQRATRSREKAKQDEAIREDEQEGMEVVGAEANEYTNQDDENVEEGDEEVAEENLSHAEKSSKSTQQVPKKRKNTNVVATAVGKGNKTKLQQQEEKPTSSAHAAAASKTNSVDEEQCRVCTTKEDLVSLFKKVEQLTVAEMLMTICPTVSIARKDFMPQFICNPCMDNITIATQLKTQCETTERELRKQLSRSKNKVRRPAGYVVIDAPVESDPPTEDEEPNDDVEFKVSDEASDASDDGDSEDSDFSNSNQKRKRPTRATAAARRARRKSAVTTPPTTKSKKGKRSMNQSPVKREIKLEIPDEDDDVSDTNDQKNSAPKKKRRSAGDNANKDSADKPSEYPCDQCEQVFSRKLSLVLHKKAHAGGRDPIACEICGKQFKIQGAYRTHLEKHKEDSNGYNCSKCDVVLANKSDLRRHLAEEHGEPAALFQCNKCKRTFVTEARLDRHKDGRCPGHESMKQKRQDFETYAVGKDLFKSVAPLTTTYWSDSFSD